MADEEGKQEGKGFTVQDRRRFSPDTGEVRKDAPEENQEATGRVTPSDAKAEPAGNTSQEALYFCHRSEHAGVDEFR